MPGTKKYRPSLTLTQINHITSLCRSESPVSPNSIQLLAYLASYTIKANAGLVSSSHDALSLTAKSPSDLLAELGGEITDSTSYIPTDLSQPHYWQQCYEKWSATPGQCTEAEVEAANEHRYLNDMMSPEEVAEFDSKASGIAAQIAIDNIGGSNNESS